MNDRPSTTIGSRCLTAIAATIALIAALLAPTNVAQASQPTESKAHDYFGLVKAYADAMIEEGRDRYGKTHSPLFAAALDRQTMTIGKFRGVKGVRTKDRSLNGANPQEDMDLYTTLYALTELTGDKKYAEAADQALAYFFKHCRSEATGFPAWGEHVFWNLENESMGPRHDFYYEINGEWPFWDACYRLAPDDSWEVALAFWDHQVFDKQTGDFSRHAKWTRHGPESGVEFPRYAGQMIITWADAYARPENADRPRRGELLTAIRVVMDRMRHNMAQTKSGYLPACSTFSAKHVWPDSNIELARCLDKARPLVPSELAEEMQQLALIQDRHFFQMPHTIDQPDGGIATELLSETGEPNFKKRDQRAYSRAWTAGYGLATHADMANLCYHRREQLKEQHPDLAESYRVLILAAAQHYLDSEPNTEQFLRPDAVAPAIQLMLNAFDMTGETRYLDRAHHFAQIGIEQFLDDNSALPRASNQHDHYEAITGGPRFMKLLLDLHRAQNKQ